MQVERRPLVAAGVAVGVAVGVTVAILAFGVRHVPDVALLTDEPLTDLPGRLAIVSFDEEQVRSCVTVMDLSSGETRELLCGDEPFRQPESVTWTPDGRLAMSSFGPEGQVIRLVDADSGEVVDERELTPPDELLGQPFDRGSVTRERDGARIVTRNDEGRATIEVVVGADVREVVSLRGPRDYAIWDARWSPDGRWALLNDSEQRLLVVRVEGVPDIRQIGRSFGPPAWYDPDHPPVFDDRILAAFDALSR